MRLYLMRHGRAASRGDWTAPDAERPLTEEGRTRTAHGARGLAALGIAPAIALSSPYERARETAAIVAAELGMPLELDLTLEPGADLVALAELLAAHANDAELLIVGHEPDLSTLIGELIAGKRGGQIELKKGACACVDLPASALRKAAGAPERLAGAGTLCWLLTAPQLALLGMHEVELSAGGGSTGNPAPSDSARSAAANTDKPSDARGSRTKKSAPSHQTPTPKSL